MKNTTFLIVWVVTNICGFSQTFERTLIGSFYNSVFPGRNVQITDSGEYLIAGKTVPLAGLNQIALTKYSTTGERLWIKTYGFGEYVNHNISIEKSLNGGYIISASGPHDIKIIKTDTEGISSWTKKIDIGEYDDHNPAILETGSDSFLLAGTKSLGSDMNYQRVISFIKINSNGEIIIEKTIDEYINLTLQFIKKINEGGYILGGYMGFQYPEGSYLYLARLNTDGDTIWTKKFYQYKTVLSSNILETGDNGFVIVGTINSAITYHDGIFLIKIDPAGNIVWQKSYSSNMTRGYGVVQTSDNGFVIVGSTEGSGNGQQDLLIMKTNVIGDSLWAKTFGGKYTDVGFEVIQTSDSGFILNGSTNSFGTVQSYLIKTDLNGDVACRKDFSLFFKPNLKTVTIDSTSKKILIHFEQVFGSAKIQLFRESAIPGNFDLVNTLTDVNIGSIGDTVANPNTAAHRYKIRVINECDESSLFSLTHRTIHLEVYEGGTNTRNLIWNHYEGFDVKTYTILRGTDKNEMTAIDNIPGSNNIYTDLNPPNDDVLYKIKAVLTNPNSNDSLVTFSNVATHLTVGISTKITNQPSHIKIYPNPFSDQTTIEFPNPDNYKCSLYIIDISGRIIKKFNNIQGTRFVLKKGNLAKGIYCIELRGSGLFREKIFIK